MGYQPRRAYESDLIKLDESRKVRRRLSILGAFPVIVFLGVTGGIGSMFALTASADEHEDPTPWTDVVAASVQAESACGKVTLTFETDPEDGRVEVYRKIDDGSFERQQPDARVRTDEVPPGSTVTYELRPPGAPDSAFTTLDPVETHECETSSPSPSVTSSATPSPTPSSSPTASQSPTQPSPSPSASSPASSHSPSSVPSSGTPQTTQTPSATTRLVVPTRPNPTKESSGGLAATGD